MAWASVCPSVRLSVTCVKTTVQARITKSLTEAAPKTLVYRDKILCLCEGISLELGLQIGVPFPLKTLFCRYWLFSVKTVADRYRLAAYHNKHQ